MSALSTGTNAGRLISGNGRPSGVTTSVPAPVSGDSDHDGTGTDSTAVGTGATASNSATTAVGDSAGASGDESTAIGKEATATALQAVALGSYATAVGARAVALGQQAYAPGDYTLAVGNQANAGGADSTAMGASSGASGDDSVAIGRSATADAFGASAFGKSAAANSLAEFGLAVGYAAFAGRLHATALGAGTNTRQDCVSVGFQAVTLSDNSLAVGANTEVFSNSDHSTVVGDGAQVTGHRSIAIGAGAAVGGGGSSGVDDFGKIKVDNLEVEASSASGAQTSVILTDSNGARWKIGVDTSGNPIGLGAA